MTDNERDAARYQVVRRLNLNQFNQVWTANIESGIPFDEIIDCLMSGFMHFEHGVTLAGDTRLPQYRRPTEAHTRRS
jgi:hypothetical protein